MPNLGNGRGPFPPQAFFLPSSQIVTVWGGGRKTVLVPRAVKRTHKGRIRVVSARLASLPATPRPRLSITVIKFRKRPRRPGGTLQVQALLSFIPVKRARGTSVVSRPRKPVRRTSTVFIVKGARRAPPAAPVHRVPAITFVKARKRLPKIAPSKFTLRARKSAAPAAAVAPRKPYVKLIRTRVPWRSQKSRAILVKKPRTPYITGVTRNSSGTPIGGCVVHVFRTSDDVRVATGLSDGSGIYLLPVPSFADNLYVVAYRADSPDIFGTTVNWLTGA